jgi:hypothetical protein
MCVRVHVQYIKAEANEDHKSRIYTQVKSEEKYIRRTKIRASNVAPRHKREEERETSIKNKFGVFFDIVALLSNPGSLRVQKSEGERREKHKKTHIHI